MQSTNLDNDTQPQQVSNAADTSSLMAGASSQHPEQVIQGTDSTPVDAAATASAPALDEVLEASLESFPASDPPAWTGGSL